VRSFMDCVDVTAFLGCSPSGNTVEFCNCFSGLVHHVIFVK
jgi:hypothetical protein